MNIKGLKVANPIKCGGKLDSYFGSDKYEITLDGVLVYIKSRAKNQTVVTSLYNTIEFIPEQGLDIQDDSKSKKRTSNSSK